MTILETTTEQLLVEHFDDVAEIVRSYSDNFIFEMTVITIEIYQLLFFGV